MFLRKGRRAVSTTALVVFVIVVVIVGGAVGVYYPRAGHTGTSTSTTESSSSTQSSSTTTSSASVSSNSTTTSPTLSAPLFGFTLNSAPATILISPGATLAYASVLVVPTPSDLEVVGEQMVGVSSELVVLNATVPDGITLHFFGSNLTNIIYQEASLGSPLDVSLLLSAGQNTAPGDYKIVFGAQSGTLSMDYTLTVHVVPYLVVVANSAFSPLNLTVKVGSPVYWMNLDVDDNAEYQIIFNGISVESPPLNPSPIYDFFSYTFTTPGTYTYYDGYIPQLVGTITVTG